MNNSSDSSDILLVWLSFSFSHLSSFSKQPTSQPTPNPSSELIGRILSLGGENDPPYPPLTLIL